jgi:signal transduction histidine kinase
MKVNALLDVRLIEGPQACEGLTESQTEALFLVARESLTNVRKHAKAHSVTATLEHSENGSFRMTIADDGKGFDSSQPRSGLGLHNIHERISAFNGQIDIKSAIGQGTQLTVDIPLEAKE